MARKQEDLVTKKTCMELLHWLENNAESDLLKYYSFTLFKAIAIGGKDEPGCRLPSTHFLDYCQKHNSDSGDYADTTMRRKCSNLSTRILQPASKRLGFIKYIRITYQEKEEGNYFQLEYNNNNRLDNMLKNFNDDGISHRQWLSVVAKGVNTGYTLGSKDYEVIIATKKEKQASTNIAPLHEGLPEKKVFENRISKYSFIQHRPAIKNEKWCLTCMDCVIDKTNKKGQPVSECHIENVEDCCRKLAKKLGGYRYSDVDGRISFYFGLKPINDQHAYTAVETATLIMKEIQEIDISEDKIPTLRIFIDTCIAMVSFSEGQPAVHFIDSNKIVENIKKYASANTVTISPLTYMSVAAKFKTLALGNNNKNSHPTGYRVLYKLDSPTAFSPILGQDTPLVGRKEEAAVLFNLFKQAKIGNPQIIFIHGIPGIGKSLLIDKMTSLARNENFPAFVLTCQCWKCYKHTPYYPISKMLLDHLKQNSENQQTIMTKGIKHLFQQLDLQDEENVSALETLIDTERQILLQDSAPSISCDLAYSYAKADELKIHIANAVEQILIGLAKHQPVILLVEDAQWADQSTLHIFETILHKIEDMQSLKIMIVITHRGANPFGKIKPNTNINKISLSPLTEPAARELGIKVARCLNKNISNSELANIVTQSNGIPLIIWERIANELQPPRWFNTVLFETDDFNGEQALLSRKMIAQIASMFGYRVNCEILKDLVFHLNGIKRDKNSDIIFEQALTTLCETGFLAYEPLSSPATLRFIFPTVRDRLYESISPQDKMQNHNRIACYFRDISKNIIKDTPETIARHFFLAYRHAKNTKLEVELLQEAVHWWKRTGQTALYQLGIPEAIRSLKRSQRLIKRLPKNISLKKTLLQILLDLAMAYQHQYGFSSIKVKKMYQQALKIAKQANETSLVFRVQWSFWLFTYLKGDLNKAKKLADELIRTDVCKSSLKCQLEAQHAMWDTLFHIGHLRTATAFHAQGLNTFRKMSLEERSDGYAGHAASVCCLSRCSMVFWLKGFIDQAMQMSKDAICEAKEIRDRNSQIHTYCRAAILGLLCKDPNYVQSNAKKGLAYADKHKLEPRIVLCEILLNTGKLLVTPDISLILNLEQTLAKWKKVGFRPFDTLWLTCIAEALLEIQEPKQSLNYVEQACSIADKTGELFYLPEMNRVKAEALIAKSSRNKKNAKRILSMAINLAEESSSQTLKLRSLVSLNRLLYHHGAPDVEKKNTFKRLQECFDWFHGGLDSTDLKTAKSLINEINSSV